LAGFGGLILLFNEFVIVLLGLPSIVLPSAFLITAATAAALSRYASADRVLTRLLVTVSIITTLLFVAALFPPVTTNRMFAGAPPSPPRFMFMLDSRLDASRRVPPWSIDGSVLQLEWAAVIVLCTLFIASPMFSPTSRNEL
jgi:hypothetical protein